MYKICFKKSVSGDLKQIDRQHTRRILDAIGKKLSQKPKQYTQLKGQFAGLRKFRVGEYRVIFAILKDAVLITRIAHRKTVYKTPV